uniref:Si:dkey-85k7.12 n=1 Tax=Poecilia reticulata TaxID=8081 RepID=A0A3P9PM73_POERE
MHQDSSYCFGHKTGFEIYCILPQIPCYSSILKNLPQKSQKSLYSYKILEINEKTINDEPPKCKSDLPLYFIKKLMMVNVTARKIKYTTASESNSDDRLDTIEFDSDDLASSNEDDSLNPLDLITALFLCSDGFVRQELALKMSMCQFSVPLLLPNCDTQQCTLMLWAMRDIVKKYRLPELSESKGFIEERIVLSELPMISFVRLGECSMSKSEILNKLLSNSEQYHDTFVHHNMECGDIQRRISNGLTEMTWYLPCGNKNMDVFSEPVAIANLRGDIASFENQFSFLCQTSAAVFVFFDQLDSECKLLMNKKHKARIFLVGNQQSKNFRVDSVKKLVTSLGLTKNNILIKTKQKNDADFVKLLRKRISDVVNNPQRKMSVEQMADVAHELGIIVDEDSPECQAGKMKADKITAEIKDTLKYKEEQLPLQGQIWKELTCLEKEEFRLRKVGSENIEHYKSKLQRERNELRQQQSVYWMSRAMICFITSLLNKETERCYFLKWMRINLDNDSRLKLSNLREMYKKKCRESKNKQEIKEIDQQLSSSSLGVEHFFREMGQIYEASLYLPETDLSRQQLQHLPKLCAQLLLDGFPLELVDGDASNIPLRWVSDVLSQLNDLVEAVYELKKNIIQQLGKCGSTSDTILEFREWITSLWNAVKHENFSFRNSLVADAYMRLCTEYNKWEWEFKKEMYSWVTKAETRISNFGKFTATSEISDMNEFIIELKTEATTELIKWEIKILDNLEKYFEQPEGHVYLVEGFREEFSNSIKSLRRQTERSVFNQITAAADIKEGLKELDKIRATYTEVIEEAVCALIDECRKKKVEMTDRELDESFDKMWTETLNTLSFSKQQTSNIFTSVSLQLHTNLSPKGSHACELLSEKGLQDCGLEPFTYTYKGHFKTALRGLFTLTDLIKARQKIADSIISACNDCISDKIKRKTNYHDTYIQEILHIIDEKLNKTDVDTDIEFEVSLKQHICGSAARKFQKMHEDFIQENDPYWCLQKNKRKFCTDFKDVFHERDQCQKKAEEFTNQSLKPAVENFIYRSLGPYIVDKMLTREEFSSRMSFQYSILLNLISKSDFKCFLSYICSYDDYVKSWISERIRETFCSRSTVCQFEDKHLQSCIDHINTAIKKAKAENTYSLKTFVENICIELCDKLVISQDALDTFMVLNNADQKQFAHWLNGCVEEMTEALREKLKNTEIDTKLSQLHVKPENELFSRVFGCGQQCPFCKIPCDAGGEAHTQHFASLHRPGSLGQIKILCDGGGRAHTQHFARHRPCDRYFSCSASNYKWHPYKLYKDIFPDWNIPPDVSLEASDYWKYVMATYNKEFAKAYDAEPADIPDAWRRITREQANASLKQSFNIR